MTDKTSPKLGPVTARWLGRYVELAPNPAVFTGWPSSEPFIGLVYVDPEAGLSLKAAYGGDMPNSMRDSTAIVVRIDGTQVGRLLEKAEVEERALPETPEWLAFFGPQSVADAPWFSDPNLQGRFHPQFPHDVLVLVHDGSPARTGVKPEGCWVRITGRLSVPFVLYQGILVNRPFRLKTVEAHDLVLFVAKSADRYPLQVTQDYVAEREEWRIGPCATCGMDELMDPPSIALETARRRGMMTTVTCDWCASPLSLEHIREKHLLGGEQPQ